MGVEISKSVIDEEDDLEEWDIEGFLGCVFRGVGGEEGGNIAVRNDDAETSRGNKSNGYSNRGKYCLAGNKGVKVKIHPGSGLFLRNPAPSAVAFLELVEVEGREGAKGGTKLFIRNVNQIKKSWVVAKKKENNGNKSSSNSSNNSRNKQQRG